MQFRPLGQDAWGRTEHFAYDHDKQRVIIRRDHVGKSHPEWVVDANNELQAKGNNGYTPSRDIQHVAQVPIAVVELWEKMYGVNPLAKGNEKLLTRLLNDSDLRGLRTG